MWIINVYVMGKNVGKNYENHDLGMSENNMVGPVPQVIDNIINDNGLRDSRVKVLYRKGTDPVPASF